MSIKCWEAKKQAITFEGKRPEKTGNHFMGCLLQFRWLHNFAIATVAMAFQKMVTMLISMIYLPEDQFFSVKYVVTNMLRVSYPASNMVTESLFSPNKFFTFLIEENAILTAF